MIEWVVIGVAVMHSLIFLFLYLAFRRIETKTYPENKLTFSILIPVRNEQENIGNLLADINKLDYPTDMFELIVVDDNSEDKTSDVVQSFKAGYDLRYVELEGDKKGKKPALELGVSKANNEIILTTDGDCRVQPNWLKSFNESYDDSTKLVVGPVRMESKNLFGALQSVDFSILIGYAASLVRLGKPSMSNGANMAYRREIFSKVNGYEGNHQVPTGDDEFLLLKVAEHYPGSISFVKQSGAVVSTDPKDSFAEFINQRKRWLSKWTLHKNASIIISVLLILIDNLAMIVGWIGLINGFISFWFLLFFAFRMVAKALFSSQVNSLLESSNHIFSYVMYELIYPFYVLLLSFASIFGNYTWKGRKYR
ncbi:MAG: glycosyltransferase [Cytophagales bacterium]|nr:glycosyltransferase [Cytophagales bacterium]